MDMKKILQAFDGASEKKPVAGANDMKKFLSIIKEGVAEKPVEETVISSFEAGSVGGDANDFLLAADTIQDEVMAQVNKIKINADEALLRDMMDKFNNFMTSYHAVGKDILQPDMFNDSMGESSDEVEEAYGRRDAYQRDYDHSVAGMTGNRRREVDDEANIMYKVVDGRLKQKMVDVRDERDAKAQGFRYEQKDALRVAGIIPSKFKPGKWVQKDNASGKWIEAFPFGQPDAPTKTEGLSFKDYAALAEAKKKIKGADGKACWDGYKYAGTEDGKDKCVKDGK